MDMTKLLLLSLWAKVCRSSERWAVCCAAAGSH